MRLGSRHVMRAATLSSSPFNEAEARAPRMRRAGRNRMRLVAGPSMRPMRVRLGCATRKGPVSDAVKPSMRPRRVRLGCLSASSPFSPVAICFNEAEARAPRMHSKEQFRPTPVRSLHEAEARAPRMRRWCTPAYQCLCGPSMRPRRVRLGCRVTRALKAQKAILQ